MFEYDRETAGTIDDLLRAVNERLRREPMWRLIQVIHMQTDPKTVIFAGVLEMTR